MNTIKLFAAALVLSAMTGCAGAARPAASPAAQLSASAGQSEVVVFVAGREGLPGKVAIATLGEQAEGEAKNEVELQKDSFVAYPAVGKQRVMVPWSGSAIDVEVGESERVYVRLSFQKGRYVFERVSGTEAQPVVAKLAAKGSMSL